MFETRFTIDWGDCDAAGIVYYPRYFDWFDRSFQRWLKSRGMSQRTIAEEFGIVGTPLIDVGGRFLSPTTFGQEIDISVRVALWEEKRFRLEYRARLSERLAAEGHEVRGWVGRQEGGKLKGLPVPEVFRQRLT